MIRDNEEGKGKTGVHQREKRGLARDRISILPKSELIQQKNENGETGN